MVSDKEKRVLSLLRNTQDPYIKEAVNTALLDPTSKVGENLRRIFSQRPSEALLEYLVPTFASWAEEDKQQAIQSSQGVLHHILRSLTREPMTAEQWRAIGKRCTKTRTRELLTALNPSDSVLVELAQTKDYAGRNHAKSVAEEILHREPEYSPERLAYAASKENSVRLADVIRDGMSPEDIARYIKPKTVNAAWSVLGTSAATDERVIRWSRWAYEANKNSWLWSSIDLWCDVNLLLSNPELLTGFLLGKTATERQLTCSETEIFRKIYSSVAKALDETELNWNEQITLRVNSSLRKQDLSVLANTHVWNHDLISNRETDRVDIMRKWHPDYPPEAVLKHITSDRYNTREVALAVALALKHYSPQNLSGGEWWGSIKANIFARIDNIVTELEIVLNDVDYVRELALDVDMIRRKARYALSISTATAEGKANGQKKEIEDEIRLRELDDVITLQALVGWRSRIGKFGREDHSLPQLFGPFCNLSKYEQQAFHTLLQEWDGDIASLCATAKSLSK